jgi:hypothetical protein
VKLLSMLADQAQIDQQQKVHALGLNWTHTHSPLPNVAVIVLAELSPDETPTALSVTISLLDAQGETVKVPLPPSGELQPFTATAVGTAPQSNLGVRVPFVVQVGAGLPLTPGDYKFSIEATRAGGGAQQDELRFVVAR